jgi:hypothetical protein
MRRALRRTATQPCRNEQSVKNHERPRRQDRVMIWIRKNDKERGEGSFSPSRREPIYGPSIERPRYGCSRRWRGSW